METYKAWQVAALAVREAKAWLANKGKIDSQDNKPYQLVKLVVSAEYCGQSSAGAQNYHKSPDAFNGALAAVIKARFEELSSEALARLEKLEQSKLVGCKDEVAALQKEIQSAETSMLTDVIC